MKIRTGFVSNSSSSSFLIFGVALASSDLHKMFPDIEAAAEFEGWYEFLKEKTSKTGLQYNVPAGYDTFYVGDSWGSVKDDETGRHFKERVAKRILEVFGKDLPCSTHAEAWLD